MNPFADYDPPTVLRIEDCVIGVEGHWVADSSFRYESLYRVWYSAQRSPFFFVHLFCIHHLQCYVLVIRDKELVVICYCLTSDLLLTCRDV